LTLLLPLDVNFPSPTACRSGPWPVESLEFLSYCVIEFAKFDIRTSGTHRVFDT
jgi:hypothetical protein